MLSVTALQSALKRAQPPRIYAESLLWAFIATSRTSTCADQWLVKFCGAFHVRLKHFCGRESSKTSTKTISAGNDL